MSEPKIIETRSGVCTCLDGERCLHDRWQATRDAALTGLLARHPDEEFAYAIENAEWIADQIHGQVERHRRFPDDDPRRR